MTIAKKYAQQYMPNGELSLEQVIQAAIDEAAQSAAVPVVGDVVALICDDCGAETNDPWHSSKGTRRHYHRCDPCNSITAAELDALRKDAERLQKDAERMQKALLDIAEWTDRYTKPGHPISNVARAAIAGEKQ